MDIGQLESSLQGNWAGLLRRTRTFCDTVCGELKYGLPTGGSASPEPMNVTLCGKKDFTDLTQLRFLRWGDDPASSRWDRRHQKGPQEGQAGDQSE